MIISTLEGMVTWVYRTKDKTLQCFTKHFHTVCTTVLRRSERISRANLVVEQTNPLEFLLAKKGTIIVDDSNYIIEKKRDISRLPLVLKQLNHHIFHIL